MDHERTRSGAASARRDFLVRSGPPSEKPTMPESGDQELIRGLSAGGPAAWQTFLERCADTVFRVVGLFASGYDERMDLFLFVCSRLHEDDMRRLRSFRFRPDAPCRFSTWLTVVVKN